MQLTSSCRANCAQTYARSRAHKWQRSEQGCLDKFRALCFPGTAVLGRRVDRLGATEHIGDHPIEVRRAISFARHNTTREVVLGAKVHLLDLTVSTSHPSSVRIQDGRESLSTVWTGPHSTTDSISPGCSATTRANLLASTTPSISDLLSWCRIKRTYPKFAYTLVVGMSTCVCCRQVGMSRLYVCVVI